MIVVSTAKIIITIKTITLSFVTNQNQRTPSNGDDDINDNNNDNNNNNGTNNEDDVFVNLTRITLWLHNGS